MKKTIYTTALALAGTAIAAPAMAHDGEHTMGFVATVMHWLSSPVHGLFTFAAAAIVVGGLYALNKKRA